MNHCRDEERDEEHHHSQSQLPTRRELSKEKEREGTKRIDEENVTGPDQDEVGEADEGQPAIPHEIRPGTLFLLEQEKNLVQMKRILM